MIRNLSESVKRRAVAMSGEILSRIYRGLTRCYFSRFCAWAILACGAYLRIKQYAFNRSLWYDEALVGIHIAALQSFDGFLQPLNWHGVDPVGFLWALKYSVRIFGNQEYALRLFPLLCGLAACVVFYKVAKKCLNPSAVPLALILFSFSDKLIYYASEVKPHSGDVLITLLIYLAVLVYQPRRAAFKWLALGGLGVVCPWFSYPSVFVMIAVITILFCGEVRERKWMNALSVLTAALIVAASLLFYYFIFLKQLSDNTAMQHAWVRNFGPLIPQNTAQIFGMLHNIQTLLFDSTAGGRFVDLSVIAAATGLIVFSKQNHKIGLALVLPMVFAYLASTIGKYPLAGRLILFYVPAIFCLIAQGADYIRHSSFRNGYPWIGILFVGLLLICPVQDGVTRFSQSQEREEIKPVLDYIERNYRPGDVLYVYYGAIPAFRYYTTAWADSGRYHWGPSLKVQYGIDRNDNPFAYTADTENYRQEKRVWFLFSHAKEYHGIYEQRFYLDYLDMIAKRRNAFIAEGASVYLYDMS